METGNNEMTLEEIKSTYTMKDILTRYGIRPNRAGFCRCPFHSGDREPSLKVYEKDFHCYACGANGDVIKFVQLMDGVSFKEAFLSLGGTYDHENKFSTRAAIYKAQKAREQRQKGEKRLKDARTLNNMLIDICRRYMGKLEPMGDDWADCVKELSKQLYRYELLWDDEEFQEGIKNGSIK